jgi:DNA ligase-1
MEEIINIIEELRRTSGTNDKIAILQKNKDNEDLKRVLKYTYDDNSQYGFSKKKLRNLLHDFTTLNQNTWANGFDMLDILSKSNINDALRNNVLTFLSCKSYEEQELWINVLTKDLRCNISGKSINKAIKGLILEFNIQQAHPIHKHPLKQGTWFCLEEKLNGINCSDLNNIMLSRQGKEISNLDHILKQINQLSFKGYYYNGELVRKNTDNLTNGENFRLTTSIVNSDVEDKTMIDFIVFDLLPIEEFYQGKSKLKYKERLKLLKQLKQEAEEKGLINLNIPKIYYEGNDIRVIDEYLDLATQEDKEGLMAIKDCEWKNKRHNGLLKVKAFKKGDFKIIGFNIGEGKFKDTLGSLIVEYKGNSVGVGGFRDDIRDDFWNNQDKYIGTIVTVKYKEETKDKDSGLPSLQFPTFVMTRPDKTEPNY